jgi:hypothetical protein
MCPESFEDYGGKVYLPRFDFLSCATWKHSTENQKSDGGKLIQNSNE